MADFIITNGTIYTSEDSMLFAEAMAIRKGRIIHVGNYSSIKVLRTILSWFLKIFLPLLFHVFFALYEIGNCTVCRIYSLACAPGLSACSRNSLYGNITAKVVYPGLWNLQDSFFLTFLWPRVLYWYLIGHHQNMGMFLWSSVTHIYLKGAELIWYWWTSGGGNSVHWSTPDMGW